MPFSRRKLIKAVVTLSPYLMLLPHSLLAAWPKQAFDARKIEPALSALYGDNQQIASDQIEMKLDKRIESGDSASVTVSTTLSDVESISLLVRENTPPLAASFYFDPLAIPYVSTRLKLAQSGEVIAVVKTAHGLYFQQQSITVIEGSCI